MIYSCCDDERRRNAVKAHPTLNGIDFLEVRDLETDPLPLRQRTLLVHFLKDLTPGQLTEKNVRIEGGERIKNIKVTRVTIGSLTSPPISPPAMNAVEIRRLMLRGHITSCAPHISLPAASSMRETSASTAPGSLTGVFGGMGAGNAFLS